MIISPWAILITPITPKVMDRPIAANKSTDPMLIPKKAVSAQPNHLRFASIPARTASTLAFTVSETSLSRCKDKSATLTSGYKLPLKVSSAPNCSVTSSFLSRLSAVMAVNTSIISAFSSCSNLDKITLVDIESTSAKRLSDACKRTVSSRWLKLRWAKS